MLARRAPSIAKLMRPAATEAELADFERYLGYPMPPTLRAIYRWHDGVETNVGGRYDPPGLYFQYWLPPLKTVRETHAMMTGFQKDGTFAQTARGGAGWWDARWIPFLHDMQGGHICVDTTGTFTGQPGQVFEEWHGDRRREVVYRDVDAWLETYVTALEDGILQKVSDADSIEAADTSGNEGPKHERWLAFRAQRNPGFPKLLYAEGGR